MNTTLTPRQQAILDAIRAFWRAKGYSPSVHEIMRDAKVPAVIHVLDDLAALESLNLIRRTPYIARSIVLVAPPDAPVVIPRAIYDELMEALDELDAAFKVTAESRNAREWVRAHGRVCDSVERYEQAKGERK